MISSKQIKTKRETHSFPKMWAEVKRTILLFTAVHPHSCPNLQANFVSPQSETVTDTSWFLEQSTVSSLEGSSISAALTNPCFSTLTEMKGQEVCVRKNEAQRELQYLQSKQTLKRKASLSRPQLTGLHSNPVIRPLRCASCCNKTTITKVQVQKLSRLQQAA